MPFVDPKISVLADIDVDGTYVNPVVTGHLTETNQQGLHPLIRRARALAPHGSIRADPRGAENVEDNAVESLRWAIDHKHDTGPAAGSVDILLPDEESGQGDLDSGATLATETVAWPAGTLRFSTGHPDEGDCHHGHS